MKAFELVIFDCDGVLVDSETITNEILLDMLQQIGVHISLEEFIARYVGMTMQKFVSAINEDYQVVLPADFLDDYNAIALQALRESLQATPGVQELIQRLPVPYCVASNSTVEKIRTSLETTKLLSLFEGNIFSATTVLNPKPAPDVYLLAAKMHNIAPEHCLVIEDTPTGIKAAKSAGMTVYGFVGLFSEASLLDAGADSVIHHMQEVVL